VRFCGASGDERPLASPVSPPPEPLHRVHKSGDPAKAKGDDAALSKSRHAPFFPPGLRAADERDNRILVAQKRPAPGLFLSPSGARFWVRAIKGGDLPYGEADGIEHPFICSGLSSSGVPCHNHANADPAKAKGDGAALSKPRHARFLPLDLRCGEADGIERPSARSGCPS